VSRYQKGKTNLDLTEARVSEWQWHQLGHMQVCTSLQTDSYASTPPLIFLQAGCPSCHPTNSVKALEAGGLLTTAVIQYINFPARDKNHSLDLTTTSADTSLAPTVSFTRWSPSDLEIVVCGRGSVLLWRHGDTLCTSGFVDDVVLLLISQGCSTSPPS